MAKDADDISMALFCDFENIALGVRDAQYEKFDIKPVLERLLLKGSIVVKKAYCDWDRYKSFKGPMHEANFELIEIPHVRQSGKNSADIRMVVDALDLCYTKAHVNTFVIISGDSDFSPLVSKLRENAKRVIGVGVKQSTSDLLIANCDEFIYVDDLVRKRQRDAGGGGERQNRKPLEAREPQEMEERRQKGIAMAVSTLEALLEDRSDDEKVWASVVKEALKRRHPGFNEAYHGYKSFGALLEDAQKRGLLEFGRDEKSGAYVKRRIGGSVSPAAQPTGAHAEMTSAADDAVPTVVVAAAHAVPPAPNVDAGLPADETAAPEPHAPPDTTDAPASVAKPARRSRGGTRGGGNRGSRSKPAAAPQETSAPVAAQPVAPPAEAAPAAEKPARKPRGKGTSGTSRRKKTEAAAE